MKQEMKQKVIFSVLISWYDNNANNETSTNIHKYRTALSGEPQLSRTTQKWFGFFPILLKQFKIKFPFAFTTDYILVILFHIFLTYQTQK